MRSIEIGAPTWLLNDPGGATVAPCALEDRAQQVLGRRLAVRAGDADDAQPTGVAHARDDVARRDAPGRRPRRRRRSAAASMSSSRSTMSSAAPRSTARRANRWPSVTSPGSAKNTEPGRPGASRSRRIRDDRRSAGSAATSRPPSTVASSARVRAITPSPPHAGRRAPHPGPSTACARPGCRGSPGGRVRPRGSSRPRAPSATAVRMAASGGLTS